MKHYEQADIDKILDRPDIVGDFGFAVLTEEEKQHLDRALGDDSHTKVFIEHGKNEATKEQSYISASENGGFETAKKENKTTLALILRRGELNALRSIIDDSRLSFDGVGNFLAAMLEKAAGKINYAAKEQIDPAEAQQSFHQTLDGLDGQISIYNDGTLQDHLNMAPKSPDGSYMSAQEKVVYEAEHNICMVATADEIIGLADDVQDIQHFESQLERFAEAYGESGAIIDYSQIEVPESLLQEIKNNRMTDMFAETMEERHALFDAIAEEHGFHARDGLSPSEVFDHAVSNGEVSHELWGQVTDQGLAVNKAFEDQFNAAWAAEENQHAQNIVQQKIDSIIESGGLYARVLAEDNALNQEEQLAFINAANAFKIENPEFGADSSNTLIAQTNNITDIDDQLKRSQSPLISLENHSI